MAYWFDATRISSPASLCPGRLESDCLPWIWEPRYPHDFQDDHDRLLRATLSCARWAYLCDHDPYWARTALYSVLFRVDRPPSDLSDLSGGNTHLGGPESIDSVDNSVEGIPRELATVLAKNMNMKAADVGLHKPLVSFSVDSRRRVSVNCTSCPVTFPKARHKRTTANFYMPIGMRSQPIYSVSENIARISLFGTRFLCRTATPLLQGGLEEETRQQGQLLQNTRRDTLGFAGP